MHFLPFCGRREAKAEAAQEPLLSSFYHASILSHDSFARSLAFVLANRLADATLLATELFEIFHQVAWKLLSHLHACMYLQSATRVETGECVRLKHGS